MHGGIKQGMILLRYEGTLPHNQEASELRAKTGGLIIVRVKNKWDRLTPFSSLRVCYERKHQRLSRRNEYVNGMLGKLLPEPKCGVVRNDWRGDIDDANCRIKSSIR